MIKKRKNKINKKKNYYKVKKLRRNATICNTKYKQIKK